jgi:hypothetical protein
MTMTTSEAQPGHETPGPRVADGHERSNKPQVNGQMAPAAMLDVEEIAPCTNCRIAYDGLSTDQRYTPQGLPLDNLAVVESEWVWEPGPAA